MVFDFHLKRIVRTEKQKIRTLDDEGNPTTRERTRYVKRKDYVAEKKLLNLVREACEDGWNAWAVDEVLTTPFEVERRGRKSVKKPYTVKKGKPFSGRKQELTLKRKTSVPTNKTHMAFYDLKAKGAYSGLGENELRAAQMLINGYVKTRREAEKAVFPQDVIQILVTVDKANYEALNRLVRRYMVPFMETTEVEKDGETVEVPTAEAVASVEEKLLERLGASASGEAASA